MYGEFGDRAVFFVVYVREAHAWDGWRSKENEAENIRVSSPRSQTERADVAAACAVKLALRIPVLVDGFDNAVEKQYCGWPDRLYVIDRDGLVAYRSGPGPFGFKPAEAEEALRKVVEPRQVGQNA
jgi:iodothyronine deiodinase-like protein